MSALLLMATTKKEPKPPKCKKSGKSLRLACEIGDISMLESALKRKKDTGINQHDTDGRYPLHIAVQKGWTDLVGRLVRAGADVNAINTRSNLWNVLHYAAHSRNKELFSYLVGVPEMQVAGEANKERNTPLHFYCRFFEDNYKNSIHALAKKGANINAQNGNGETPLHNACWKGHLEIVQVLLDLGANPNLENDSGETALHWAARMGQTQVVQALMKAGADPTIAGKDGTAGEVATDPSIRRLMSPPTAALNSARAIIEPSRKKEPFHWEITMAELQVGEQIGSGGFGVVHKGTWRGIEVAIKMIHGEQIGQESFEAFLHEISVISKLRHPNVLLFLGASLEKSNVCLVTEHMPRGNLRDLIRKTPLDHSRKLTMISEMTRGIQYLHSQTPSILHRDLKSLNILVDDDYHVKVADFGSTVVLQKGGDNDEVGVLMQRNQATLYCLAPEVLEHEPYSARADIYALGMVIYELITETIPYEGLSSLQLLRAIDEGKPLPMPENCDPELVRLVHSCLARDPKQRPTLETILDTVKNLRSRCGRR